MASARCRSSGSALRAATISDQRVTGNESWPRRFSSSRIERRKGVYDAMRGSVHEPRRGRWSSSTQRSEAPQTCHAHQIPLRSNFPCGNLLPRSLTSMPLARAGWPLRRVSSDSSRLSSSLCAPENFTALFSELHNYLGLTPLPFTRRFVFTFKKIQPRQTKFYRQPIPSDIPSPKGGIK